MSPVTWTKYLANKALSTVTLSIFAERVLTAFLTTLQELTTVPVKLI